MIATLLALICSVFLLLHPELTNGVPQSDYISILLLTVGALFTLLLAYSTASATRIMQKAEKRMIPRVIRLFEEDSRIIARKWGLAAFAFLSFALSTGVFWDLIGNPGWLFCGWLLILGFAIDGIRTFHDRVLKFADPLTALDILEQHANKAAESGLNEETSSWLDSLSTLAVKATEQSDSTLAEKSVRQMFGVLEHLVDKRLENRTDNEKLSFSFIYAAQRWELIFRRAAKHGLEDVCLSCLHQLGKTAVLGAEISPNLAALPIIFMGKLSRLSREKDLMEVADQNSCILIEVARAVLEEAVSADRGFEDPLLSIIAQLEENENAKFEKNSSIDMDILKQPFRQILELLKEESVVRHKDAPAVLQELERVVGDLANLELVLRQRMQQEATAAVEAITARSSAEE